MAAEAEKPQWDRKYPPEAHLLLGRPKKNIKYETSAAQSIQIGWNYEMYIHTKYSSEGPLR